MTLPALYIPLPALSQESSKHTVEPRDPVVRTGISGSFLPGSWGVIDGDVILADLLKGVKTKEERSGTDCICL